MRSIMFVKESHLVDELVTQLTSSGNPFAAVRIASEFGYLNGRADVVAVTSDQLLITFEAKLIKWKKALDQAYRNSAFSHYSYVVLPTSMRSIAMKRRHEFERRGVGLCSIGIDHFEIDIQARKKNPLQPWLTESAFDHVECR